MKDPRFLRVGENCPSPITRVLALGYTDGPTEGVLQFGEGGPVFRFSLIDEVREAAPDRDDLRLFGLSGLPVGTLDELTKLLSPYLEPRWPVWVPVWRFPTEEIQNDIEGRVDSLLGPGGPVVWLLSATDLLGTVRLVRKVPEYEDSSMITLTADDTTLLKDVGLFLEPVEVYDDSGKLLGLFVPANLERGKELSAKAAARVDWAEIERRDKANEPGVPLADALARLKQLEAEFERRKASGLAELTPEEALAYFRSLRQGDTGLRAPSPEVA
jgi:hypothetical protein